MAGARPRHGVGERFWRLQGAESENLIKEVRNRPSLWDDRNEDFKHPKVTARLWEDVGEALNMPGDEMRKKWKNLKDKYRKTLQDQMFNKKGPNKLPPKPWKYGHLMEFTKESLMPSVLLAGENFNAENENTDEAEEIPVLANLEIPEAPAEDIPTRNPRSAASLGVMRRRQAESELDYEPDQTPKRRFALPEIEPEPLLPPARPPTPPPTRESNFESREHDDDYMFLMSLHPFLKPLSAFEKLELRSRMLSQVMETYRQHQQRSHEDPHQAMICDAVSLEPNTLLQYGLSEDHKADLPHGMIG